MNYGRFLTCGSGGTAIIDYIVRSHQPSSTFVISNQMTHTLRAHIFFVLCIIFLLVVSLTTHDIMCTDDDGTGDEIEAID